MEMKQHKVFCCGLTKTGTTSMKAALKILGYDFPNQDMSFNDPAINASCSDNNVIPLTKYQDIDKRFDNTKFIMTFRDSVDVWYDSICRWAKKWEGDKVRGSVRKAIYGSTVPNETFIEVYLSHSMNVMGYFFNKYGVNMWDKVLPFNTDTDGWVELCEFLDEPTPSVPYPHKNKNKNK